MASLFHLSVKPFRLQKSELKTTATFLEDKDIQNMAKKRKNLLTYHYIKTKIWNELPNLTISVEKTDTNILQGKHAKAKPPTASGRKQSKE